MSPLGGLWKLWLTMLVLLSAGMAYRALGPRTAPRPAQGNMHRSPDRSVGGNAGSPAPALAAAPGAGTRGTGRPASNAGAATPPAATSADGAPVAPRPGLQVKRTYHDRQKQFLREEYTYYADRNGLEVRHGLYVRLYENGRFHERGTYVDGRMEGLWTRWTYRDLSTNVYSPVKEISAVYEIPYKGGLRVGLGKARETCNGGLPYREYTYNDLTMKEEGPCVQYGIDNGQAYMEGKGAYKDGRMDGVWVHYYPTGKPRKQESYAAGVRHGVWKTYRPTGLPQEVKEYSNGRLDGQYVNYYANGKAWTTGTYNKDERNGKWVKYSEDGRLVAEEYYDSGRSVGTWKIYRPDGRVLSTTEKRGQRERDPNREVVRY